MPTSAAERSNNAGAIISEVLARFAVSSTRRRSEIGGDDLGAEASAARTNQRPVGVNNNNNSPLFALTARYPEQPTTMLGAGSPPTAMSSAAQVLRTQRPHCAGGPQTKTAQRLWFGSLLCGRDRQGAGFERAIDVGLLVIVRVRISGR
jgi:hypothetical protein